MSHNATSIRAACMGMGFAWFAEEVIREELDAGLLEPLPLDDGAEKRAALHLVFADGESKGRGVGRFGDLLRERVVQCPTAAANPP